MINRLNWKESGGLLIIIFLVACLASLSTLYIFREFYGKSGSAYIEKVTERKVYLEESATISAVEQFAPSLINIFPGEDKTQFLNAGIDFQKACLEGSQACKNTALVLTSDGLVLYGGQWQDKSGKGMMAMDAEKVLYELELVGKIKGFSVYRLLKEGESALEKTKQTRFFDLNAISLADQRNVRTGQAVLAVESVLFDQALVEPGLVSGKLDLNRELLNLSENLQPVKLLFDPVIQSKKGYYFNLGGQLLLARAGDGTELGSDEISALLKRHAINDKLFDPMDMGLKCYLLDKKMAQKMGLELDYGCLVAENVDIAGKVTSGGVKKASISEKAGIRSGDIIMEVDNQSLLNVDLMEVIMNKPNSEKIRLNILRGNKLLEITLGG